MEQQPCKRLRVSKILATQTITASAPCRIDLGGTLDIRTFYYPLRHLKPCTFNIALDLRTQVRLFPFETGMVKVSSKGFKNAVFPLDKAPFDHPLGLIFAVAAYFGADGVHIQIESLSPPRSSLGGSSAMAVALVKAFAMAGVKMGMPALTRPKVVALAHGIEESVAGVPCGLQDQLAAAYGGVNTWYWPDEINQPLFRREIIFRKKDCAGLSRHLLVAYGGVPHASKDINGQWIRQFLAGQHRKHWTEIIHNTKKFIEALKRWDFKAAAEAMNREMALRRQMTPEVLDNTGLKLVESAVANSCGARFAGAGGGGCIWALGAFADIQKLKNEWKEILQTHEAAQLLPVTVDTRGLCSL